MAVMAQPFKRSFQWYSQRLESHPLTTKAVTSGVVSGAGDFLCQFMSYHYEFPPDDDAKRIKEASAGSAINEKDDDDETTRIKKQRNNNEETPPLSKETSRPSFLSAVDWARTGRFTFLGIFLVTPIAHNWYGMLMRRIPGNTIAATVQRTFWDQAVCAPLFLPTFMISLKMLEGESLQHDIWPQLQSEYTDILTSNWIMWIPAQLVNFRYVPCRFQVLFSNMTAMIWNIYFSYKTCGGLVVVDK
jgi:hypothetical protein